MVALLVVVVVLLVVAVVYWLVRRRADDEVHSVEGYRHTLDTLQDMRQRSPGTVRVLGRPDPGDPDQARTEQPGSGAPGSDPASATRPSATGHGTGATTGSAAGPGRPAGAHETPPAGLVFEDPGRPAEALAAGRGRDGGGAPDGAAHGAEVLPPRRSNRRAISSMNHRPRKLLAPIATAVVVLILIGVLAYVGSRSPSNKQSGAKTHHTTTTRATTSSTSTTPTTGHPASTVAGAGGATHHSGAGATGSKGSGHGKDHKKKGAHHHTTPTTAPPSVLNPVTATATSATYTSPAASYSLTLSVPSGACWVSVQTGSAGSTVFSGTLQPGQHQSVPASGVTRINVGAPSVLSLAVNGVPVTLPTGALAPFIVTLQPSTT